MSTINELREMIKMVEQSSIQRFEHETTRIVIVKGDGSADKSIKVNIGVPQEELSGVDTVDDSVAEHNQLQPDASLHKITSPTMGTYYSASQPGEEPFVKIGQTVDSATVVCVLEAMKLFTEIVAGVDGRIEEVLVKDGDFIEYGQPLFIVSKGE
ncbi:MULTISPECIES: acetyl-CoA carboxylase biotin carboxyl carrier protein [unclassified Paenibacillus]|uniref:acetyl-CoA carboxylase biotin carboxyl carrier protein n=1 Tax=unclassified Paenibacillus TaxID=185978 RepID=UPI002404C827|nr:MULTISPECIES: acetyl-CoA carboxylase biotin carboxyl carrier protein [unclassified Paenibacillus]MDF9840759.1 acetyl-CoA carboxylase biotin carboxyl carrier protein [Paenibacillus sp. PastF-2]MDF9847342.1 acetyl-CoA carboxylase biotin carboxyl carrier protein [Paenibacillus sp. PastM-2]MDF9854080.1 acetyl-CoA carboxylase biotin carboxyl carrier protein [Paenibacillus sp. PastF-1]MDH6479353.1 acetyl-CoA carboxylase biotin carboxyl carrier protein [Paenibacillus sp. PastH-2]MDH6506914.1 acety